MRILVLSDLHMEHGAIDGEMASITAEFDVVVLAGDVSSPLSEAVAWIARERDRGAFDGRPVVYVPGNHEFYHGQISADLGAQMRDAQAAGVHLLAPGSVAIDGVRFVGATLWTNYALNGDAANARITAEHGLNDHRLIRHAEGGRSSRFSPTHALSLHRRDLAFIEARLAESWKGPTVVVTHHAPHPGSVAPRYKGDPLSAAFASDLSATIERFAPDLWIHGHDHGSHDYRVGTTRVLSNQAGYPTHFGTRENPRFDPNLVVAVTGRSP